MAKAPIPGSVKTRLRLPPERSAQLQRAFTRDTVSKALTFGPVTVAGAPSGRLDFMAPLLPPGVALIPQPEGDLGYRMLTCARSILNEAPGPVLILGTDAPTLPLASIRMSARALEFNDLSIIPSFDGGYVLLGLREPHEAVFVGIEWSTDRVYCQTLENAWRAGLTVWEGEPWYDVDTRKELNRLRGELRADPERAPLTAEALKYLD